ncbi:MAG: hypothetical protein RO257_13120 [Candidatus Kapabacteria bacterium]|nr:hypothetical protein [Candidatus Kapabacteria bacterium]
MISIWVDLIYVLRWRRCHGVTEVDLWFPSAVLFLPIFNSCGVGDYGFSGGIVILQTGHSFGVNRLIYSPPFFKEGCPQDGVVINILQTGYSFGGGFVVHHRYCFFYRYLIPMVFN